MNAPNIGIVGAGNMGRAIAWAMHKLDYDLIILDKDENGLYQCQKYIQNNRHKFVRTTSFDRLQKCEAVISSLPYHQNIDLANFCINNKIRYFDLGGNIQVSETINENARDRSEAVVMTDLGLAPGWVNIIAENMCQAYMSKHNRPPNNIVMMVGGLPQEPNNTLKYSCTWSYDGLINEYKDNCIILYNGEQISVPAMEGYEFPIDDTEGLGPLEAFYTSGGIAHTISTMQKRGVLNCSYKTIRYPGHHQIVKFLIQESGLSNKSIIDIFKRTCPPQKDIVIIKVITDDETMTQVIKSDEKFSAMQKATAFPIVAAAHTVAISDIDRQVLKYSDLNYPQFNKILDTLMDDA